MSAQVLKTLRRKIARLQESRSQLDERMQSETAVVWGEEYVQRKQALLTEREIIESRLSSLRVHLERINETKQRVRTVTVDTGQMRQTFTVVPSALVAPQQGLISFDSPLARALLNAQVGTTVQITTPSGERTYRLLSIT